MILPTTIKLHARKETVRMYTARELYDSLAILFAKEGKKAEDAIVTLGMGRPVEHVNLTKWMETQGYPYSLQFIEKS